MVNTRAPYATAPPPPKPKSGRPYTLLGAVLAVLGFGVVIFFGSLSSGASKAPAAAAGGQKDVVVAKQDISSRTAITPDDVTVAHYAAADIPPGAFARIPDVRDMTALVNIKKGQPLTSNLLAKPTESVLGGQAAYLAIPSGWVALTLPTGEEQGVAGYIQAGDYISIVGTVAGRNGSNIRTLFTNVHVLRVGPAPSDQAPVQGTAQSPPKAGGLSSSITIVVTQCQAEYLGWFIANASVRYTLESYKDYKPQDVAADATCPSVSSATGVSRENVSQRWPGIFS